MEEKKEELTLIQRLVRVQQELKAPKGQMNKFGGYKYRSAEDILEAVKPILGKLGLVLTLSDEPILVGDWHYIKATARVTLGSDYYETTAYAREAELKKGMDESQVTGTASSYARKYALNGLFAIDDTKDSDTDEVTEMTRETIKKPTPEHVKELQELGGTLEKIAQYYKKDVDKLTDGEVTKMIDRKKAILKKKQEADNAEVQ